MAFVFTLAASCATTTNTAKFMEIQPGMEEYQVKKILGEPIDRSFNGTHDEWFYRLEMGDHEEKTKVVFFDNKRVTHLGDDIVQAERNFELAKARRNRRSIFVPLA